MWLYAFTNCYDAMKVSFGRVSVTPANLDGLSLAGFYRKKKVQGVLDTLYARGVLVEDTFLGNIKKRMLLISIDTMKVPLKFTDYVKEKIQDVYKINPSQILIHAIHSHSGLDLTGEYYYPGKLGNTIRSIIFGIGRNDKMLVWMTRQIVKMVGQLLDELQPCKIAWAKTAIKDRVILNRRHFSRTYRADLGVICFKHADSGAMIGFMVNFGAHPTLLPGSNFMLSAEWPGRLVASIDEATDNMIQAVFFNDAAGDISPSTSVYGKYIKTIVQKYGHKRLRFGFKKLLQEKAINLYGAKIGLTALDLARSIPDERYFDHAEFKCYTRTIWIPMQDYKQKYNGFIRCQNRVIHWAKKYFLMPLVFAFTDGKEYSFPGLAIKHRGLIDVHSYSKIQYFRVLASDSMTGKTSSFNIIGMPGEPFRHLARSVQRKTKEGLENSFLFQMANDWMAYLFDFAEYTRGGGDPFESMMPVAGKYVKEAYLQLLDDIEAGLTAGHA